MTRWGTRLVVGCAAAGRVACSPRRITEASAARSATPGAWCRAVTSSTTPTARGPPSATTPANTRSPGGAGDLHGEGRDAGLHGHRAQGPPHRYAALRDAGLRARGGLPESVTVEGQASALETSNASVGSTLDKATLETLPTAGRNPFFLATIRPGCPPGDPQFIRQQDQTNSSLLSLGGGPRRGNNYTLDGVAIVDLRNRATFIPSIEAVEEVKVQVSTYDAEMGRTGGGVFNMTGKSGANAWHGSLLGQNRPSGARSPDLLRPAGLHGTGRRKPDTYFQLYAGSLGGPIVKDKTFFWATSRAKVRPDRRRRGEGADRRELTATSPRAASPSTTRSPRGPTRAPGSSSATVPGQRDPADRISPVARSCGSTGRSRDRPAPSSWTGPSPAR